uniref:F-box protein AT5G49610-like beta-propeller domain-containing protein n=1 Tax=Aegilops tauschii TaxID=37682 RepID=M8CPV7_AEGTA
MASSSSKTGRGKRSLAMCMAAATRTPSRWSWCPYRVIDPSPVFTARRPACGAISSSQQRLHVILIFDRSPGTLVGNVLYWPSRYGPYNILEFDLDSQNLTVIKGPRCINNFVDFQIIRVEDDDVGLAVFSCRNLQVWQRKVDCQGVAIWLLQKNVALHDIIELSPQTRKWREVRGKFVGYDEDTDEIFLSMHYNVYMVQLKSMQSKTLKGVSSASYFYPFTSFYPPGDCPSLLFIL